MALAHPPPSPRAATAIFSHHSEAVGEAPRAPLGPHRIGHRDRGLRQGCAVSGLPNRGGSRVRGRGPPLSPAGGATRRHPADVALVFIECRLGAGPDPPGGLRLTFFGAPCVPRGLWALGASRFAPLARAIRADRIGRGPLRTLTARPPPCRRYAAALPAQGQDDRAGLARGWGRGPSEKKFFRGHPPARRPKPSPRALRLWAEPGGA